MPRLVSDKKEEHSSIMIHPLSTTDVTTNSCLSWSEISFSVGQKNILQKCSGRAHNKEVLAILGPSGSGKTTLLDILASRVSKTKSGRSLTGQIDIQPDTRMRYVQQEDALVGILTVRETLTVAAHLAGASLDRVDTFLEDLGLKQCEHTMCGTIFFKGISGGQKRRLRCTHLCRYFIF